MQDDILPVLGVGQRVRALTMEKAIDHDLVHHALAHPFRRIIFGVIYGDLKALFAAHYAFAASGMIRRCAPGRYARREVLPQTDTTKAPGSSHTPTCASYIASPSCIPSRRIG